MNEIKRHWTLDDIADAYERMIWRADENEKARREAARRAKR